MCSHIYYILACGCPDTDKPHVFKIKHCEWDALSYEDKGSGTTANGAHVSDETHERDTGAICQKCRNAENRRARDGVPLKWPSAKKTVADKKLLID